MSHKHKKRLQLNFEGFDLGIWAKPGADYVCLAERWIGCADADGFQDDFTKKEKVVVLPAGKEFQSSYSIK